MLFVRSCIACIGVYNRRVLKLAKQKKIWYSNIMENEKRMAKLPEKKYLVTFGIRKATFDAMFAILESAYKEMCGAMSIE